MIRTMGLTLLLALFCVSVPIGAQTAPDTTESVVIEGPALSQPANAEVIPAPVQLVPVAAIKYDIRPSARRIFACHGAIETVLAVDNVCDGSDCLYAVPVQLPGCCTGAPIVRNRRGLFGRSVVEYFWPCGYEVEIVFRLRGDLAVKFNAD